MEFGSKVAEEVGFERIREKQSDLSHLRVAILDGQRITGTSHLERAERQAELEQISEVCQSISELDLSRSLLESWEDVVDILVSVAGVKQLRLK